MQFRTNVCLSHAQSKSEKGILRMGDLISDNNELILKLILKSNYNLRELDISPLDIFRLASVSDTLPVE